MARLFTTTNILENCTVPEAGNVWADTLARLSRDADSSATFKISLTYDDASSDTTLSIIASDKELLEEAWLDIALSMYGEGANTYEEAIRLYNFNPIKEI